MALVELVSLTAIFVSKRLVFGVQLANLALQLLQLDHELRQLVCIATATATATTTTGVYDTKVALIVVRQRAVVGTRRACARCGEIGRAAAVVVVLMMMMASRSRSSG